MLRKNKINEDGSRRLSSDCQYIMDIVQLILGSISNNYSQLENFESIISFKEHIQYLLEENKSPKEHN